MPRLSAGQARTATTSRQAPPAASPAFARFLPYLPDDNQCLSSSSSAQAVQSISDELGALLALPDQAFWDTVAQDESLHACLDSFLRHRRRGFDLDACSPAGDSVMSEALARQVFMVLMRLVTPVAAGAGGPSPSQQADLLYNRWILDVPKLMDIAVLYGPDNLEAARKLLISLFELQPKYLQDVANMVEPLGENLSEVHARSNELCAKIGKGEIDMAIHALDAAAYLLDACLTLKVFCEVYPPAARLLLGPHDTSPLLGVLANLHRRLLPTLLHALRQPGAADAAFSDVEHASARVELVALALEALLHQLLASAFLSVVLSPSDRQQGPEARGQQLLTQLMSASQAIAAITPGAGGAGDKPLLQLVSAHFGLDAAIVAAAQQGIITLDDAQFDYLMALLGSSTIMAAPSQLLPTSTQASSGSTGFAFQGDGGHGGDGGSGASSKLDAAVLQSLVSQVREVLPDFGDGFILACLEAYENNAEQVIHHLLEGSLPPSLAGLDTSLSTWPPPPTAAGAGKGKGKAAANPGAASKGVPSSGTTWPGGSTVAASSSSSGGGGSGAVGGSGSRSNMGGSSGSGIGGGSSGSAMGGGAGSMSWRALAAQAEEMSSAAARGDTAAGSSWGTGTGSGARQVARSTLRALGGASRDVKTVTKQLGNNMQWDYEDEYDDSFDDLNVAGADGVADVEGDELRDRAKNRAEASDSGRGRPGTSDPFRRAPPGSGSGGSDAAAAGGRGEQRPPPADSKTKLWVLDGRIYNYKKEGAQLVESRAAAERAVDAAKAAAEAIYGLGAGGNVPLQPPRPAKEDGEDDGGEEETGGQAGGGPGGSWRGGPRGRGGPPRGGGGGRGGFAHKDRNKAAIGNHHRKDRAFKKMGFQG